MKRKMFDFQIAAVLGEDAELRLGNYMKAVLAVSIYNPISTGFKGETTNPLASSL